MSNNSPEGWLVILGDAYIGETLTARPNAVTDADGINYSTVSFQWLRDGKPIPGATKQTYDVTTADTGTQISVQYLYRDNRGNNEIVTSKPEPKVPAYVAVDDTPYIAPTPDLSGKYVSPNNSDPTGWLVILGDAEVGATLTARPNAVEDADGINQRTVTYQWFREDKEISGANGQTYVVTAADQGTRISVEYAYTDFGGSYEVVYSKPKPAVPYVSGSAPTTPVTPTTPVVPPTTVAPTDPKFPTYFDPLPKEDEPTPSPVVPTTPTGHVNSGPVGNVFILGFPLEGSVLLARTDALYDRDSIVAGSGRFQWLRDGEPIDGATGKTYTVTEDDRGAILSVQYSYMDGKGTLETVVSDPETPVPFPEGMEPETPAGETPPAGGENPRTEPDGDGGALTTPEDDVVTITSSMSRVDGLAGTDTAVLAGDQTNYTVAFGPDGVTVTDRSAGGVGPVELVNFEFLDFGTDLPVFNGPMNLGQFGGHTGLGQADFEAFVEMYIAYFNRAPDAIGLSFWGTAFANGTTLEAIASMFADQPETLATYPADTSNIKFTADVYENVLGRSPDIDGLRFWTEMLDSGAVSRGEFILEVLRGVKAPPPADATEAFIERQLADQAYLENKTDLGALFAVHRGMSNVDDASMVMSMFDGSDASLATAVEAVETLYAAAQDSVSGDFLMPLVGVLDNPFEV